MGRRDNHHAQKTEYRRMHTHTHTPYISSVSTYVAKQTAHEREHIRNLLKTSPPLSLFYYNAIPKHTHTNRAIWCVCMRVHSLQWSQRSKRSYHIQVLTLVLILLFVVIVVSERGHNTRYSSTLLVRRISRNSRAFIHSTVIWIQNTAFRSMHKIYWFVFWFILFRDLIKRADVSAPLLLCANNIKSNSFIHLCVLMNVHVKRRNRTRRGKRLLN